MKDNKKPYVNKVCILIGLNTEDTNNLTIIFDKISFPLWSIKHKWGYYRNFGMQPFDLVVEGGYLPEIIEGVALNSRNGSLIWISYEKSNSTDIDFCWVLAHELQHHKQHMNKLIIKDTEQDADFVAAEICSKLFGKDVVTTYLDSLNSSNRCDSIKKHLLN